MDLRRLVLLHADLVARADRAARIAARLDRHDEPERADMERDTADHHRATAEALASLLEQHGVARPDPRQLALMGLGDAA